MAEKLSFNVVYHSSQDEEYPAAELNTHSPQTRGWQSFRYCEYPQELGFEIEGGTSKVTQVQILSHQSKITTKLEIFIGNGPDYHSAKFKRLGYLSLDSNERSEYQARELKTVHVESEGKYIRFVVHRCFLNKFNMFQQVGIVAVSFLGIENKTDGGKFRSPARGQPSAIEAPKGGAGGGSLQALSNDLNLDPQTANKLRLLAEAKIKAVEIEDYATAKQIKLVEKEIQTLGVELAQLDIAKQQAVKAEDYDRAMLLKNETDELRAEIEDKVRNVRIPGVSNGASSHALPPQQQYTGPSRGSSRDGRSTGGVNVDEIRVGGTGNGNGGNSRGNVFAAEDDDDRYAQEYEDEPQPKVVYGGGGAGAKQDHREDKQAHGISSLPEEILENGDRPIRPKEHDTYLDADPEMPTEYPTDAQHSERGEQYQPGDHPLEGISNFLDLPAPEQLQGKYREPADSSGLTALVGDYRVRCLFSKTWALRDAAVNKFRLMMADEFVNEPGIPAILTSVVLVLKTGLEDKIAQVFFSSAGLMEEYLALTKSVRIARGTVAPLMDPLLKVLIDKLSDGVARIRDTARGSIEAMAACPLIGPSTVASHGIASMQKSAWRPILGRLQLLTDLVTAYGIQTGHKTHSHDSTGLTVEAIMLFIKNVGAFSHSNGEVRDGSKDLVVAVQKYTGTDVVMPFLKDLRPKQLQEYMASFIEYEGDGEGAAAPKPATKPTSTAQGSKAGAKQSNKSGGAAAKVPTSAAKSEAKHNHSPQKSHSGAKATPGETAPGGGGEEDFTKCMFCGKSEAGWTEDLLDLHYWKECPLLTPCPACAQIVEIAGLPEHLLEECEHKLSFESCETTGLAIRKEDFSSWKESTSCVPPADNAMYCPLCLTGVVDSDEAWRQHLLYDCARNARTYAK